MNYKITKVAENNVEVFKEKTIKDINNIDRIILEYVESYSQDKIDEQLAKANQELADAENLDEIQYKTNLVNQTQILVDKLTQALMLFDTEEKVDKDGNVFQVYDEKMVERFSKTGVSPYALEQAKRALINAQNMDEVAYKQSLINKAIQKINHLNSIQQEMDRIL